MVEEEIQPFTVTEAQRILAAAAGRRNGVRFALGLALGLRPVVGSSFSQPGAE